ncbi:uncharacterized protein N7479_009011 [Penicillium vulpinum]|uniref:Uncharacterized protein n=1 Tax=Penicillium vulpinum TaxID=29845 RepID=A0A1V6RT59_9EURO|nr:uncharacterized protein N7479_009011 [Penicillium vulpinum]KAJ5950598.1 hypothetical protein N7479_009011 [Penicillium vulpinum]OQE04961.1 hypothetical protein PENVUL_c028G05726 [Penicillium vulpinum]
MKFWKLTEATKQSEPKQTERFPIEAAEAFDPKEDVIRRAERTGSPPGTLLCSFPDPAPGTSLNQFRFQLHRANGVQPGVFGYLEKYVNSTHLVWSMCAILADSGIDPAWKDTFELWRPQWRQFAKSFEIHGNTMCTMDTPASPVTEMRIQRPNSLAFVTLTVGDPNEKQIDRNVLEDLWKWMLDTPPEAIIEGAFIIRLQHEEWFPEE